jgi:hypothetical protein
MCSGRCANNGRLVLDPDPVTNLESQPEMEFYNFFGDLGCRIPFGMVFNSAPNFYFLLLRHKRYELKAVHFNFMRNALSATI